MFRWVKLRQRAYLDSHVGVSENHVEVIVGHAELFPQLSDQILVYQVLLTKTLHRLIILWRKQHTCVRHHGRDSFNINIHKFTGLNSLY